MVSFISASTIVSSNTHSLIIISGNCGNISFSDLVNNFILPDIIADKITQAVNKIRFMIVDTFEAGLQGRKVTWMSLNNAIFILTDIMQYYVLLNKKSAAIVFYYVSFPS